MTPEKIAPLGDIWKIVLGAILALMGGFLGRIWDEWRARRARKQIVLSFAVDVLDSYVATFSELLEYQGQTGTIWISIVDRMIEEYPAFSRNREQLIMLRDPKLRRDIQSTIIKLHTTASQLKTSVVDEMGKANAKPVDAEQLQAASKMTRHRFEQLRAQIDQARDIRQRIAREI